MVSSRPSAPRPLELSHFGWNEIMKSYLLAIPVGRITQLIHWDCVISGPGWQVALSRFVNLTIHQGVRWHWRLQANDNMIICATVVSHNKTRWTHGFGWNFQIKSDLSLPTHIFPLGCTAAQPQGNLLRALSKAPWCQCPAKSGCGNDGPGAVVNHELLHFFLGVKPIAQ